MKVHLSFVPPNGGETDYSLTFDLPAIPRSGDYISIVRPGETGADTFIVRRTWWNLKYEGNKAAGIFKDIWVECEFAVSSTSSDGHKKSCEIYQFKTGILKEFDESMY